MDAGLTFKLATRLFEISKSNLRMLDCNRITDCMVNTYKITLVSIKLLSSIYVLNLSQKNDQETYSLKTKVLLLFKVCAHSFCKDIFIEKKTLNIYFFYLTRVKISYGY
jgi:hypothetical protein